MTIKPGVEFIAPFRIYLPEKFYMVTLGGKCHLAKPLALPPIKTDEGTQVNGRNIEISHDIFGYAGRTKFSIAIDKEIDIQADDWKQVFVNDESFLINEAIAVANRMLDVYRDQDRNSLNDKLFHVIPLVKSDFYSFRIVAIDQEFNEISDFAIIKPSFHRVGFGTSVERKPEIVSAISKLLEDGTSIPIYRELLNSSLNYIWRGQYRIAPVEANTALESFVPEIIHLLDPSVNRIDLTNLYKKLLKLEDVLSISLDRINRETVSWFTKPSKGWKSLIQYELKDWYGNCYLLRNKVIHEGCNDVSRQDAIKAYEGSLTAINYIQAKVREIFNI